MKDIAKYLKIDHRSTILVYKGNEEVSRTLGQLDSSVIYSNIERKQTNTEVRLNVAFSPKMTFEAYYQPFSVTMDYEDYNRLDEEGSLNVSP